MTQLTKENLQKFIDNYISTMRSIQNQAYTDGVNDVLADLHQEFDLDNVIESNEATVLLKSGIPVKVSIEQLGAFLYDHADIIQAQKLTRKGPVRNPCSLIDLVTEFTV